MSIKNLTTEDFKYKTQDAKSQFDQQQSIKPQIHMAKKLSEKNKSPDNMEWQRREKDLRQGNYAKIQYYLAKGLKGKFKDVNHTSDYPFMKVKILS